MKKSIILIICGTLLIFGAGCTETKGNIEVKPISKGNSEVRSSPSQEREFKFTPHQEEVITEFCDEKDDNEIAAKTTFDEEHCYHV